MYRTKERKSDYKNYVVAIFIITLILVLHAVSGYALSSYKKYSGDTMAHLIDVYSNGKKMYVTLTFTNNGKNGSQFDTSFRVSAWQNGFECTELYSDKDSANGHTNIKDGASVEVTKVYEIKDLTSIVEIDLDIWPTWEQNPEVLYFNPSSQVWGVKSAALKSNTPEPINTPKGKEEKGVSDFEKADAENKLIDDIEWICPNCGNTISSKFCPDCGVPSPTPKPTEIPVTPSPVPMNIDDPVENVVKHAYQVSYENEMFNGLYTGEAIDGFPHGYGFFECDRWIYFGDWSYGSMDMTGEIMERKGFNPNTTTFSADTFLGFFDFTLGNPEYNGKRFSVPYRIVLKDAEKSKNVTATSEIGITMMISIYNDKAKSNLVYESQQDLVLIKDAAYSTRGNFIVRVADVIGNEFYADVSILSVTGSL